MLPVHPVEHVQVPGLLHTPLTQLGEQTAEKENVQNEIFIGQ